MTPPLEIHRTPPPGCWRALATIGFILLGGLTMLVAAVVASLTQDLSSNQYLSALFVGVVGAGGLLVGCAGIGDAVRLLQRPLVLRLDESGLWLRTGSPLDRTAAAAAWTDIDRVEVGTAVLPAELFPAGGSGAYDVLRFVPTDGAAVQADPPTTYDALKAVALGLPPDHAVLTMILGPSTARRIPEVEQWLARWRPGLRVVDTRGTASA